MKRFLMLLMVAITCVSFMSSIAEAKRFGGGSSFGKSRPAPTKQSQRAPESTPKPAQSGASKWLGPLAGLAVGAALASMFAGSGMGDAMGSILMALAAAAAIMFLIARFKKSQQPTMQYAGNSGAYNAPSPNIEQALSSGGTPRSSHQIPHDFPVDSFLRSAKASFIRLQAANDRKDINDVREYTTPEVFAEISMQMQERGSDVQTTEIVAINAELLEVANEDTYVIASVRFTGQMRENNGPLESIDEVWHIQKDTTNSQEKWLLAGIQQLN
ncbi:transporter [Methylotenera oryzisoli]|uniref:Transporter n=1 Tax=Methylotenera oryzisoli TaxID=2080758 RepID=A0A4Y9VPY8_9PROT|nr:Tim44-like domain-containing protein [Methylotenera oryzisoli]TFW70082.1 transporter [Methylotenera oryzisoli]